MGKRIVICLDGTGNELKAKNANTNVVALYDLLDLDDPAEQVAYYDPGVGTFSSPGAWTPPARLASRVAGLAFGAGLRANLAEAYTYLMRVYQPGDRIYLLGFSRGAYTARALAGLVHAIGIFRPGAENLVQYAVSSYVRQEKTKADWDQLTYFRWVFSHPAPEGMKHIPIEFLGIWDTVKATGWLRWDQKWPWTRSIVNVRTVRHAVSIDEYRKPYRHYAAVPDPASEVKPDIDEVWFAGVHSDVGGTFPDNSDLARIALKWMAQSAYDAGVLVKRKPFFGLCRGITLSHANGTVHRMGKAWRLVGYRKRVVPKGALVHDSVRARLAANVGYRFTLPDGATYADPGWAD